VSRALISLTPAESKRLIAKSVARLPEVLNAMEHGRIIVVRGSTTTIVVEELHDILYPEGRFLAGYVGSGGFLRTPKDTRKKNLILVKGQPVEMTTAEALAAFEKNDVFIKGANMLDPQGVAGGMLGSDTGGTTGESMGILMAKGSHIIIPVGLEKLVPNVPDIVGLFGNRVFDFVTGDPVGVMPIVGGHVVNELEAFRILFSVKAYHVGGGGIDGAEGAINVIIEGSKTEVEVAFQLVETIKGEPPFEHAAGV